MDACAILHCERFSNRAKDSCYLSSPVYANNMLYRLQATSINYSSMIHFTINVTKPCPTLRDPAINLDLCTIEILHPSEGVADKLVAPDQKVFCDKMTRDGFIHSDGSLRIRLTVRHKDHERALAAKDAEISRLKNLLVTAV